MPYIDLKTNVKVTPDISQTLSGMFGREIELVPGKSERWLMTSVQGEISMTFAGSDAPCAIAVVSLFGSASDDAYAALSASLCEKIGSVLNIPCDRIYVKYEEVSVWGWNGVNF